MLRAIVLFLIGNRRAIHSLARAPRFTLPVGALLVFSAALARNYDGEDLLAEPWHLLGPFAASLVTSIVLFILYKAVCSIYNVVLPWKAYAPFLGLYWLTAPLAWLYGIPFERFASAETAIYANLWLLLIVSAWRVVLMARVAQVMLSVAFAPALFINLLFGAVVIFAASLAGPVPIVDLMGGLRLSPEERLLGEIHFATLVYSFLAIPVLFIFALIGLRLFRPSWPPPVSDCAVLHAGPAFVIAVVAVLAWLPGLLLAQPEQQARRIVESAWEQGNVHAMLREMSGREPGDYPPHWRPPRPRSLIHERVAEEMINIFDALADIDGAPWVREFYLGTVRRQLTPSWPPDQSFNLDSFVKASPHTWTHGLPAIRLLVEYDPRFSDADCERLQRFRERVAAAANR